MAGGLAPIRQALLAPLEKQFRALARLAIVRLSLTFAVIWLALICATIFGLDRARLDMDQTAAVEGRLAAAAGAEALAQAPQLHDAELQAALAGRPAPAVKLLNWRLEGSRFVPADAAIGVGALPVTGGFGAELAAGRQVSGPILVGGHAHWALVRPLTGADGAIVGAAGAGAPFPALDRIIANLAANPAFSRGFLAVVDGQGRLMLAASGLQAPKTRLIGGALRAAIDRAARLGDHYLLANAPVAATSLTVVAGVSLRQLDLQTIRLVGVSQSLLAMVIVISLCLAWLMARRLSEALEEAERARAAALASKVEAEQAGEALAQEVRQAARYVESLLPPPGDDGPVTVDWLYRPSTQLGGDAFGYFWLDERRFVFYLLDVCGHGVGAALLATTVMSLIRARSLKADLGEPSSVLTALNAALPMARQNDMYFTIWYGVYEPENQSIRYASGGQHPAVLLSPGDEPQLLQGRGAPIGCFEQVDYPTFAATTPAGADLYLFSDGLFEVERRDGAGMLSLEAFVDVLAAPARETRARGPETVLAAVQEVQGRAEFDDDCAILELRFQDGPPAARLRPPAGGH